MKEIECVTDQGLHRERTWVFVFLSLLHFDQESVHEIVRFVADYVSAVVYSVDSEICIYDRKYGTRHAIFETLFMT